LVEHNNTNFKNLKIVETGNFISAAYCSKLFSDLDAQIIKIEKHQPSFMKKHGFDYKSLAKINPKLILTSITPFWTKWAI